MVGKRKRRSKRATEHKIEEAKLSRILRQMAKFILVNEDWHPTIDGKVEVMVTEWVYGEMAVQVCGAGDFGLILIGDDWDALVREFDRIANLTSKAELHARGFTMA